MARHSFPVKSVQARIVGGLAVLGIGTAVALGVAAPAEASGPAMTKSFTPWVSTWSIGYNQYGPSIGKGAAVTMRCWNTGAYKDGTAKWLYVSDWNSQGYVPANDVWPQVWTPHC